MSKTVKTIIATMVLSLGVIFFTDSAMARTVVVERGGKVVKVVHFRHHFRHGGYFVRYAHARPYTRYVRYVRYVRSGCGSCGCGGCYAPSYYSSCGCDGCGYSYSYGCCY